MSDMTHTIGTIKVESLPGIQGKPFKNPGDVDFEVKYPEGYKGPKYMPEGVVTTSKESAEKFTEMGIGKVVEAKTEKSEPEPETETEPELKTGEVDENNAAGTTSKESAENETVSDGGKKGKGKGK